MCVKNRPQKENMEKEGKKMTMKKKKVSPFGNSGSAIVAGAEPSLWNTGFSAFKRRIGEQLQLGGFDDSVDDETLLPFYRMGESETYVLSALGCPVGM